MSATPNLCGERFGNLFVKELTSSTKNNARIWKCICGCGKETYVRTTDLLRNRIKSCGCLPKSHQLPPGEANFNALLRNYKRNAQTRNLSFELTEDQFRKLTKQNCYYCGDTPSRELIHSHSYKSVPYIYNGIDRLDCNKGYFLDNCVACCFTCNRAKDTMTKEEFLLWIRKIYNNFIKEG